MWVGCPFLVLGPTLWLGWLLYTLLQLELPYCINSIMILLWPLLFYNFSQWSTDYLTVHSFRCIPFSSILILQNWPCAICPVGNQDLHTARVVLHGSDVHGCEASLVVCVNQVKQCQLGRILTPLHGKVNDAFEQLESTISVKKSQLESENEHLHRRVHGIFALSATPATPAHTVQLGRCK